MRRFSRRRSLLVFPVTLLISCVIVLFIFNNFQLDSTKLGLQRAAEFNEGWNIVSGRSLRSVDAVPRNLTVESSTIILRNTLPEFHCSNHALCFRTNNERVRVSVNGETIYSYGYKNKTAFGKYFGTVWNMVSLDADHSGKSVTVELDAMSDDLSADNYRFYLDNRSTIICTLLFNNWILVLNILVCLAAGLMLVGSGLLYLTVRYSRASAPAYIWLGVFVLFTQFYVLADSGLMQFFINNKAIPHYIVHSSLMLMPVPFAMYLGELFPRWQKEYRNLSMVFCAYYLLRMALYVSNLLEINRLLTLTHGLILLGLTYSAILLLADTKSVMSRIMLSGIIVFFLFVFGAILIYYTVPHLEADFSMYTLAFSLGIDVLMIFFYTALLRNMLNTASHMLLYQQQAYTDSLTQVNNRAAFNLLTDEMTAQSHPRLTLLMVDLNNLKLVNDTLGHPAGDKLICALVDCMSEAFREIGKIYRYGGDEFVVLIEDAPLDEIMEARTRFDQLLEDHSRHGGQEIGVAVGMASRQDPQFARLQLNELLHVADVAMYQIKAEYKAAQPTMKALHPQRLEKMDPATGILTFAAFKTNVYNALAEGTVDFPCIVTFDVNFFDGYNNLFGWEAGNRLLLKLTSLALSLCGEKGFCGHGDADSFWVYTDTSDLETLTARITAETRRFQDQLGDCLLFPSFGIYCISERMLPVSDMCSRATSAKKRIKGHLDVLYTVYSTQEHQRRIDNMRIISYMQKGLDSGEFIPHYQPKFSADGTRLLGAEALARWSHTDGESPSAAEFTALFEKSGLILKLDWYMLEKACAMLRSMMDQGLACVPVSTNFSRLHVYEPGCAQQLIMTVDSFGVPHEMIEIELTETALVQDSPRILRLIDELQQAGFTVSLDDFGSGVSSLGSLNNVRVDVIKIDRSLIEASGAGHEDNDIFEFVVKLCRHLGIRTLAEGVENESQLEKVRNAGCDLVQGNYFSAPLPETEFRALLTRHRNMQNTLKN